MARSGKDTILLGKIERWWQCRYVQIYSFIEMKIYSIFCLTGKLVEDNLWVIPLFSFKDIITQ